MLNRMDGAELIGTPKEQRDYFNKMKERVNPDLALFYSCIRFDIPFSIDAVPEDSSSADYLFEYIDKLKAIGHYQGKNRYIYHFSEGMVDIKNIFGVELNGKKFNPDAVAEKTSKATKYGTERQRDFWDEGFVGDEYRRLDQVFSTYANDFGGEDTLTGKQKETLKSVSRMTLELDKCIKSGDSAKAKQWTATIQETLSSDNMRKKDAKPLENMRIDAMTMQLQKVGLLEDGAFCNPSKMFKILFGEFPQCEFCQMNHSDKCKYDKKVKSIAQGIFPYTADAIDHTILYFENRMRQNDGMQEISELPDEARIIDTVGAFAEEQSEIEKNLYNQLGIVKMPPIKRDSGETK